MAYDVDDVVRSVRRYLAATLGAPWEISLAREDVAGDDRPAALIEVGALSAPGGRVSLQQGPVEHRLPITITCWPPPAPDRWASHVAYGLVSQLNALVVLGLDLGNDAHGRPAAGPYYFPLYDYSGTPPLEAVPGPEHPHARLLIESHSAHAFQDVSDSRRWNVVLELAVSWWAPGRVPAADLDAPLVQAMPATFRPTTGA